jgi:hypothetical protein
MLLLLENCFCFVFAPSFITRAQSGRNTVLPYSPLLHHCVVFWDKETARLIHVPIRRGVDSKLKFLYTLGGMFRLCCLRYGLTITNDVTLWNISLYAEHSSACYNSAEPDSLNPHFSLELGPKTPTSPSPPPGKQCLVFLVLLFSLQEHCNRNRFFFFFTPCTPRSMARRPVPFVEQFCCYSPMKGPSDVLFLWGDPAYFRNREVRTREKRGMSVFVFWSTERFQQCVHKNST